MGARDRATGLRGRLAILALMFGILPGWSSPAPDVVVYTLPCLLGPVAAGARAFRARTGIAVHVFASPKAGLIGLVRHRARDDLLVADSATIATLAGLGLVVAGSTQVLGRDPVVLIGRAGQAAEPAASLLQHLSVTIPDDTTASSLDGPAVLAALAPGADQAGQAGRVMGVAETRDVVRAVSRADSAAGLVYATDIAGWPRLVVLAVADPARVAPMPVALALTRNGQSANAARLAMFLGGSGGRAIWQGAGLLGAKGS